MPSGYCDRTCELCTHVMDVPQQKRSNLSPRLAREGMFFGSESLDDVDTKLRRAAAATPTLEPTPGPSLSPRPTATPTALPTLQPTVQPTAFPTSFPTLLPSAVPTLLPTSEPSRLPTLEPTVLPTQQPTAQPTISPVPTPLPTLNPTPGPSLSPWPTALPTLLPSATPTGWPSSAPTISPAPTPVPTPECATPGQYYDITTNSCEDCPAGRFANASTHSSARGHCEVCAAGSYSEAGHARCRACARGRYAEAAGAGACVVCSTGKIGPSRGLVSCERCAAGKFNDDFQMTDAARHDADDDCDDCGAGRYSAVDRARCVLCPGGTYVFNMSSCEYCTPGKYAPTAVTEDCIACAAGFATGEAIAATSCSACEAGKQAKPLSVDCTECDKGKASPPRSENCTKCPVGFYADVAGMASCVACAPGRASGIAPARAPGAGAPAPAAGPLLSGRYWVRFHGACWLPPVPPPGVRAGCSVRWLSQPGRVPAQSPGGVPSAQHPQRFHLPPDRPPTGPWHLPWYRLPRPARLASSKTGVMM